MLALSFSIMPLSMQVGHDEGRILDGANLGEKVQHDIHERNAIINGERPIAFPGTRLEFGTKPCDDGLCRLKM